jgi:hypothetical protein
MSLFNPLPLQEGPSPSLAFRQAGIKGEGENEMVSIFFKKFKDFTKRR